MHWVSINEDKDTGLRVESETHQHNKSFSEDPNSSNLLDVILRCSTLLGCDLFFERTVRENILVQGAMRNMSYIGGRASSQHKAEINEGIICERLSFGIFFTPTVDGYMLQKDILSGD